MSNFKLDFDSRFYKNCRIRRKQEALICQECPFRKWIEKQEEMREGGGRSLRAFADQIDAGIIKDAEEWKKGEAVQRHSWDEPQWQRIAIAMMDGFNVNPCDLCEISQEEKDAGCPRCHQYSGWTDVPEDEVDDE